MNARVDHLLEDVLSLSAEERSVVAAALLDSLENSDEFSISDAWRVEIKKRRDDLHSGRVTGQAWSEVRSRLKAL